ARVLDGFAGTGALGIEALSRGAAWVTFVERDRRAQALVAENLARCGVAGGYAIIRASVAQALDALYDQTRFDIVLLDPPYDDPVEATLAAAGAVMAAQGLLVLEHARRKPAPADAERLVRTRHVVSGDSGLAFYEVKRP